MVKHQTKWLPPSAMEWAQVRRAQEHPDASRYTRITVGQTDNVTKLPAPDVIRSDEPDEEPAVQVAPTPSKVEEPIAEPIKRETKKEEPPLKDDIAEVLSAWADE